jgi:Centromere-binding protein ParB C-terminal
MKPKRSPSFSLSLPDDTADQVRAAQQAVGAQEGYASVNELLTAAVNRELRRLQRKYNKSRAWEGIGPGALRPGMRTRAEQAARHQDKK